jgi:hypothetical protein
MVCTLVLSSYCQCANILHAKVGLPIFNSFCVVVIFCHNKNTQYYFDITDKPKRRFDLLEAINYNALLFFLLSNVLTGIINISIKTIYMESFAAFAIVFTYLLVLCVFISVLYYKEIKFKFW